MRVTVLARIEARPGEAAVLADTARRWSACMRYAYRRLLEGEPRRDLKRRLQGMFGLNSRYVDDAILRAREAMAAARARGEDPRRVVWGGRGLFRRLCARGPDPVRRERVRAEWRERRQMRLYGRGDVAKGGNLNLRVEFREDGPWLRVNAGRRRWLWVRLRTHHRRWERFRRLCGKRPCYAVEVKRVHGRWYAHITFEEPAPAVRVDFSGGAMGVDLNAVCRRGVAWAVVGRDGNIRATGVIRTDRLVAGRRGKREWWTWAVAHAVVDTAVRYGVGLVLERLRVPRRRAGTGRGTRRVLSAWRWRRLAEAIAAVATRRGVAVRWVDARYTSVIGGLKYGPLYGLDRHRAAAVVIARRALGFGERVPRAWRAVLSAGVPGSFRGDGCTPAEGRSPSPAWAAVVRAAARVGGVPALTGRCPGGGGRGIPRDLSVLRRFLVEARAGPWGQSGWESPTGGPGPGTGLTGGQSAPAGTRPPGKRRVTNRPAPTCDAT